MGAHGSGELARHFCSDNHWIRDVTYRVQMGLPILNRLMEPMTLTDAQVTQNGPGAFVELREGYPIPEDLLPEHSKVESSVPFMTPASSV